MCALINHHSVYKGYQLRQLWLQRLQAIHLEEEYAVELVHASAKVQGMQVRC